MMNKVSKVVVFVLGVVALWASIASLVFYLGGDSLLSPPASRTVLTNDTTSATQSIIWRSFDVGLQLGFFVAKHGGDTNDLELFSRYYREEDAALPTNWFRKHPLKE